MRPPPVDEAPYTPEELAQQPEAVQMIARCHRHQHPALWGFPDRLLEAERLRIMTMLRETGESDAFP